MTQVLSNKNVFKDKPSTITHAVSYMEKYKENEINDDGTINDNPQIKVGVNINYHTDWQSAVKDKENLNKITNREYFDIVIWVRSDNV